MAESFPDDIDADEIEFLSSPIGQALRNARGLVSPAVVEAVEGAGLEPQEPGQD